MATHPAQRSRRPQTHQANQAPMHALQNRETSRSPSIRDRPRAIKAQSMPLVPSVGQMYSPSNPPSQNVSQVQQQPSPTSSNNSGRSPPSGVQITRMLPTPPHPNPNIHDAGVEHRISPPLPPQHSLSQNMVSTHYPRPINRMQPQFLSQYQNLDDNLQMTEELLADIERAADQQQSQNQSIQGHPYNVNYGRGESPSPPKDPGVERVRVTERSSPKDVDTASQRRQREQQPMRESPKTRDRQPTSPTVASFRQAQALTPERRMSPAIHTQHVASGEHHANYTQYTTRESPPVHRRPTNTVGVESRTQLSHSSQSPPLQSITARTPDRSLPVQEEPEDEPSISTKNGMSHDDWKEQKQSHDEQQRLQPSPTPSSDILPEEGLKRYDGNHPLGGRDSRSGHREDNKSIHDQHEVLERRYMERDRAEDEGGYTPRSPTAGLPDNPPEHFPSHQNFRAAATVRPKGRNGTVDQLGLRTLDPSVFEPALKSSSTNSQLPTPSDQDPKQDVRRSSQDHIQYLQQNQQNSNYMRANQSGQYYPPQVYPDDFPYEDAASAYIQAYLQSPRPDAPIPPTPHSQTAAPSPSPHISSAYNRNVKDLLPFSPIAPVGSPYPYPFTHVRRNQQLAGLPNRPQFHNYDPNHPSVIQEQMAKQWQIYAQNNHGNITDSTFSPSTTPFQAAYNPWAFLHTNRTLGRPNESSSLQSSPSHEPVPLPPAPNVGLKKKDRLTNPHRNNSQLKPPPRVESTQPRETSPELSSSGEETAGEERYSVAERPTWTNGLPQVVQDDDSGDWIDEDDDGDEEELLELEYHPTYINNVERRRRKWEIGWEALTQAFQTLDRQTDATMVLLASPSHSTKLHIIKSRSIRRRAALANSASLKDVRTGFRRIASERRSTRSHKASLIDRFLVPSTPSGDGSDNSSESREEDLRRALEAAIGSLGALSGIYEQREARWAEEMRRVGEDRERVELLLRQVLGENHPLSNGLPRRPEA